MGRLQEWARATPADRVRSIDLVRAVAILAVVVGHWLAAAVIRDDGVLTSMNALEVLHWAHPLTWLLQVMPLFFIVGGYANAASYLSHRDRGGDWTGWLLRRSERLVRPVTVLLVVLSAAGLVAALLGADTRQLGIMAHGAVLPLWFLVAYLAVTMLTPLMYALHRRFGLAILLVLVALMVAGDLTRLAVGAAWPAGGNFLFLWLAVHQAGMAWQDGRLPATARVAVPIALTGVLGLVLATVPGPYPISMINVPGAQIHNVSPPSLALLALATAQLGLALLLKGPGERWMQRTRPWGVVIAINTVTFSMFLWHMPALVVTALVLDAVGLAPELAVDSPQWLAWQVPWVVLLSVVLVGLLAIFARAERAGDPCEGLSGKVGRAFFTGGKPPGAEHGRSRRSGLVAPMATVVALVLAVGGMLVIAEGSPGDHGLVPLPTSGVVIWLLAASLLWLVRLARAQARPR